MDDGAPPPHRKSPSDLTGRADIDVSLVDDCRRLAKQCKMADLIEELQLKCKRVYEFGKMACVLGAERYSKLHSPFVSFFGSAVSNKPGICVKVLSLEPHSCQLQEDMAQLADCALPPQLRVRIGLQTSSWLISIMSRLIAQNGDSYRKNTEHNRISQMRT